MTETFKQKTEEIPEEETNTEAVKASEHNEDCSTEQIGFGVSHHFFLPTGRNVPTLGMQL